MMYVRKVIHKLQNAQLLASIFSLITSNSTAQPFVNHSILNQLEVHRSTNLRNYIAVTREV